VSFQTARYCWVCQVLHETSFQIINMYSIFYETQLDQLPWFVLQLRVRNSCVEDREVKRFNAIAGGDRPWLYVLVTDPLTSVTVDLVSKQITSARKGHILFCKQPLWFHQKVLWNWYHQHARVFDWQHICFVWLSVVLKTTILIIDDTIYNRKVPTSMNNNEFRFVYTFIMYFTSWKWILGLDI
jgi:hypothetical protein